jgi:DNA polymerase III alpha subunit (gram-positive type)
MSATAIKGLMDIIEARFKAVLAKQDDTIRVLEQGHAAEIQTLYGKSQTLTDELSEVKIMQTRMAASVSHQQQQPQQHQQPQQQQQPQQPQQQQLQQQQQQRPRNPSPQFQPMRSAPELNEEEFPSLPTSEWKV